VARRQTGGVAAAHASGPGVLNFEVSDYRTSQRVDRDASLEQAGKFSGVPRLSARNFN